MLLPAALSLNTLAANRVADAGFETTQVAEEALVDFADGASNGTWTVERGVQLAGHDRWFGADFGQSLHLNSAAGPGAVRQVIATKPGGYEISLAYAMQPECLVPSRLEVMWNGAVVGSAEAKGAPIPEYGPDWHYLASVKVNATTTSSTLAIRSATPGACGAVIDDVQLVPSSKEPHTQWTAFPYPTHEASDNLGYTVSRDGRYVVFYSPGDLLPLDRNQTYDLYRYHLGTRALELVSVNGTGSAAGNATTSSLAPPVVSPDGRFIAFVSAATDLVTVPVGKARVTQFQQVFWRDMQAGRTLHVSQRNGVPSNGASGDGLDISDDGRVVAFGSPATNLVGTPYVVQADSRHLYVWQLPASGNANPVLVTHNPARTVVQDDYVGPFQLSGDGRYVSYTTGASNAVTSVPPPESNSEAYLYDRTTDSSVLASRTPAGAFGGGVSVPIAISPDGNRITFYSSSNTLVAADPNASLDTFQYVRSTNTVTRLGGWRAGGVATPVLGLLTTRDGRFVLVSSNASFTGDDTNSREDVYLIDTTTNLPVLASAVDSGTKASANGPARLFAVSDDGRTVVFMSDADDLVPNSARRYGAGGDSLYVRDMRTRRTRLLSRGKFGEGFGAFNVHFRIMSSDGARIVLDTNVVNLAASSSVRPYEFNRYLVELPMTLMRDGFED